MAKQLGIDIGTATVKLIVSDELSVKRIGMMENKYGKAITQMTNSERIQFADDLKKMMLELGVRETGLVASIPEPLTFSKLMKFPRMSIPELSTAIKWELDQSVPFPPNEIESSWSIFDKGGVAHEDTIYTFVVAVPSKVSELYVQLFELLDLDLQRLENETVPLVRAFTPQLRDAEPTLIVDLGASGSKVVLASKEMIFGNYFFAVGGISMTKLIADSFGLTLEQAEQYKRSYGLQQNQLDGKVFLLLKPIVDNLVLEIRKMIISYRNDFGDQPVNKMIITGGGAYLQGLIPYLSANLEGVEVSMGNVFEGVDVEASFLPLAPVYSLALGLSN